MMILQQTRGALSSGDQLALDLPFAETKSLAARIGPTPTFTRGSGATYVGSDGLIHGVDTSTTSNTIGTGSKTFTLAATAGQDQLYRTGDAVDASNGSNSMVGTVTSYTPSTQVLVCNITSVTGSGTFSSWRIGYRGPRFDHNPVSPFASRGLLIEEGRTNLLIRSEDFSTSWTRTGLSTVSTNAEVAPDGATTADKLVENTSSGFHGITQIPPTVAGTTYFGSIFIKASGRNFAMIYTGASGGNGRYISIPADGTGTVLGNYNANNSTVTLQYIGNGWYRATILVVAAVGTGNSIEAYASTNGTTTSYTGDGTSGILVWGAQVEAGSFPTSYIPTTTSALARSADVCSITGANFTGMWNASEGTMFINSTRLVTGTSFNPILSANDGNNNNRVAIGNAGVSSVREFLVARLGTGEYSRSSNISADGRRMALAYSQTSTNSSDNASLGTDDTSSLIPSVTQLVIGVGQVIPAIRYYKKRLPNAKLVTLTV